MWANIFYIILTLGALVTVILASLLVWAHRIRKYYLANGISIDDVNLSSSLRNFIESKSDNKTLLLKNGSGSTLVEFKDHQDGIIAIYINSNKKEIIDRKTDELEEFIVKFKDKYAQDVRIFLNSR